MGLFLALPYQFVPYAASIGLFLCHVSINIPITLAVFPQKRYSRKKTPDYSGADKSFEFFWLCTSMTNLFFTKEPQAVQFLSSLYSNLQLSQ
jgi:hypothetical protein